MMATMDDKQGAPTRYKIVAEEEVEDLEEEVEKLMKEGWKPLGGVVIGHGITMLSLVGRSKQLFLQAMTR